MPSKTADTELKSSLLVTSALQDHILSQDDEYGYKIIAEQLTILRQPSGAKTDKGSLEEANNLTGHLPDSLQRAMMLAKERGSSTWLTALPLAEHDFTLHKGAFRDALALRYGWTPSKLQPNVTVEAATQWNTHCPVPKEAFHQSGTMRSVT